MNQILAFACVILVRCFTFAGDVESKQSFSITADLAYWDSVLVTITVNGINLTTDSVRNGKFEYHGEIDEAKEATFTMKKGNLTASLPFFVEPGKIIVTDVAKNVVRLNFSGTSTNDEYTRILKNIDSLCPRRQGVGAAEELNEKSRIEYAENYIRNHLNSIISLRLFAAFIFRSAMKPRDKMSYLSILPRRLVDTYNGQLMAQKLYNQEFTSIGKPAPEFTQNDPSGLQVSLKTFRGKYVLIDFWAAWCVPCREENPAIKKAYEQFKDKGFTILSVSLDKDKKAWINAIAADGLSWTHVSDLKFWDNTVAKKYAVEGIPDNFLLDPQGVIIARNLKGEQLAEKLTGLLP